MRGIAYGPGSTSNLFAILICRRERGGSGGEVNYQRTLDSKNDVADAFEDLFKVPKGELEEWQGVSSGHIAKYY